MSDLASKANREYSWEYNEELNEWRHLPAEAIILRTKRLLGFGAIRANKMGLVVPQDQRTPSSDHSSYYHIHPRAVYEGMRSPHPAILPIKNQLPSNEDLRHCIEMVNNGYEMVKIVTELGVTALKYDDTTTQANGGKVGIPGYSASKEWVQLLSDSHDTHRAIHEVIADMNETYDGQIILSYKELH